MKHSHRRIDAGSITRGLAALSLLLLGIFSGNTLLAQNPAYVFASQIGGAAYDRGNAIATDASGNLYVTGTFQGTVDFDPGVGSTTLTGSATFDNVFVASYDPSGTYRWAFGVTGGGRPLRRKVDRARWQRQCSGCRSLYRYSRFQSGSSNGQPHS